MPYYGPKRPINITRNGKQSIDTIFYHLSGFSFYDQNGNKVNNRAFIGRVWVAGFTSFPGKDAPSLAVMMNRLSDRTNLDTALRLVTFTLDSESVQSMQAYAKMIHCTDKRRLFLSGNTAQLRQFATEDFYKAVDSSTSNGYVHFFLIDKEGCIRGIYNGLHVKEVDYLIDDINTLEAAYYIQNEKKHKDEHDNDAI